MSPIFALDALSNIAGSELKLYLTGIIVRSVLDVTTTEYVVWLLTEVYDSGTDTKDGTYADEVIGYTSTCSQTSA